jgi:uncharacterized membrane protein
MMADILPPLREPSSARVRQSDRIDSLKNMAMAVYVLNLLAFFNGVTAIFGAIIAYVKQNDAAGTVYASHFQQQLRVFWIALVAAVVGWVTVWILIGWPILLVLGLWYLYRNVSGLIRLANNRPAD